MGDFEIEFFEAFDQIHRSGLSLDIGIGGDDDLFDFALFDALDQLLDIEFLWPGSFVRFYSPAEDMIESVEFLGIFDDGDVDRFLDDADDRAVAFGVQAEFAQVILGDIETILADLGFFF